MIATLMFSADNDDHFPVAKSTAAAYKQIERYMKNTGAERSLNPNGGKFEYNFAISGKSTKAIQFPAKTVMFYETKAWPDGRRVVSFADGHVKWLDAAKWAEYSKSLNRAR